MFYAYELSQLSRISSLSSTPFKRGNLSHNVIKSPLSVVINELKQGKKSTLVIHEHTASQTEQDDPWHPSRYTWCAGSIYGGSWM